MDTLPEEIINEILLVVNRPALFHASQVCIQWRRLSLKQVKIIETDKDFNNIYLQGDMLNVMCSKITPAWLEYGLHGACQGGHKEMVELMIDKGAARCSCGKSINGH